jgi:hypothetical protein
MLYTPKELSEEIGKIKIKFIVCMSLLDVHIREIKEGDY